MVFYYGVYDFINVENMYEMMMLFLEYFVMCSCYVDNLGLFKVVLLILYVYSEVLLFFVLYGEKDLMVLSV